MNIIDVLCYIRKKLIEARENKDEGELGRLLLTLKTLDDVATETHDSTYITIIDDLVYAIQNSFIAEAKVTIPTEEEIRSISSSK